MKNFLLSTPIDVADTQAAPDQGRSVTVLVVGALAALLLLVAVVRPESSAIRIASYLPFHAFIETFAIVVAIMIFGIGWNVHRESPYPDILFIACAFLGVGLLDFGHMFSYQGMPEFVTPASASKAIDFWLAARLFAALALLFIAWSAWSGYCPRWPGPAVLAAVLGLTGTIYWLVLYHGQWLPETFVAGIGLTPFKIRAEYLIIGLHAITIPVLLTRHRRGCPFHLPYLIGAVAVMGMSELCFTLYVHVSDAFNLLGHVYKIVAYGFVYRALFVEGVRDPYRRLAKSRQQLQKSEQHFRNLLEFAPDAIFITDPSGQIVMTNRQAELLSGYDRSELVGEQIEMLVPERHRNAHMNHRERYASCPHPIVTGMGTDVFCRCKDGSELPIEVSLRSMEIEGERWVMSTVRDVSERKMAESEFRKMANRLVRSQQIAHVGNWEWDIDAHEIWWSDEVFRIFGKQKQSQVVPRSELFDAVHPDDRPLLAHAIANALADSKEYCLEYRICLPDGSVRWVENRANVLPDAAGKPRKLEGVLFDITLRKEHEERLMHQTTHDVLTGLPNRLLFRDRLGQALSGARRRNALVVVMLVDLDAFKNVNETLGHDFGDALLCQAAARLLSSIRKEDSVARQGGDEFALLFQDVASVQAAVTIAENILGVIAAPFSAEGREMYLSASIGITVGPTDGNEPEKLLKNADIAMNRAKEQGRNTFQFYTEELNGEVQQRLRIESNLRVALEKEQFELFYQPKIDVPSGRVTGMEALLRWRHPDLGLVPPDRFIPVAEETGMILPIGEWVLREACTQVRRWQDAGMSPMRVAVNLSTRQFRQKNLVATVRQILEEAGLEPRYLELEVTESAMMADADASVEVLREISAMGVAIAVDDFGTGYSSLSYLKQLPLDSLKIDRSFIQGVTDHPDDASIVNAIISLAHTMHIKVVAEGVETENQLNFLTEQQCEEIQGYYFSKPLPADQFEQFVQKSDVAIPDVAPTLQG